MTTRRNAISVFLTGIATLAGVTGAQAFSNSLPTTQFKVPRGVFRIRIKSVKPDGSTNSFNFDVEPGQVFFIDPIDQ